MVKKSLLGVSLMTMTLLYALLFFVVFIIGLFMDVPLDTVILISIGVLIIQFLVSPFLTDLSMKWFYKAKFGYEVPEYLKSFIEQVCKDNNMKYPRIGFIDDGAPNAFTYGHTKNNARVVITRGIFDLLTEEEVKAVVGHELGHAAHYDMLFMTVAQLVPLVLYYIYAVTVRSDNNRSNNNNGGNAALIGFIAYILYIISNYIVLSLSRQREYYADNFSVEVTKNPRALGEALVKIGYGLTTNSSKNSKFSASKSNALGIFDAKTSKALVVESFSDKGIDSSKIKSAMKWERWNLWAKWYEIQSTHPLISKRLESINEQCATYNQEKYIDFDLDKPESYVDDFFKELLIHLLPGILLFSLFIFLGLFVATSNDTFLLISGLMPILALLAELYRYTYKFNTRAKFNPSTVEKLLGEVKVSGIRSIPCELEGELIGKGDPGCIFDDDFTLKDSTGIIFLNYDRVIGLANFIFGLFKSKEFIDKHVKIKGWYMRKPVPYVEVLEMTIGDTVKRYKKYSLNKFLILFLIVAYIAFIFIMMAG